MRFYLHRLVLDMFGYDTAGKYYGLGLPLWWYSNGEHEGCIRAPDRDKALKQVRDKFPDAVFFRGGVYRA